MKHSRKFPREQKGYTMTDKAQQRKSAKEKRLAFSCEYIKEKSRLVLENIAKELDVENLVCMSYVGVNGEIDLSELSKLTKNVIYYPQTVGKDIFAKSTHFKVGAFGISQPTKGEVDKREIDVCFVPGVAYCKNMQRIGYGGGYYDRFLADFRGLKVGITYEELVEDFFEGGEFDVAMDMIITDKKIYKGQK